MTSIKNMQSITETIDDAYKSYAMYVLENRAIPSYIDGFKPVHRKLFYTMINDHKNKKVKCSDASGISKYGYHHGEASAAGALITLSAAWNNNVPLFSGHGNFGSRLIQDAAAPRYIFVSNNPEAGKYFKDFEVCDESTDDDSPEPRTYLPTVPWVLVNGIEGIAVGFACRFLPHHPADLVKACRLAMQGRLKDDHHIPVTFPGFKGKVIQESPTKVVTEGLVIREKRNTWRITEAPWGYDRETLFNQLTKLIDDGKIQDFEDECDESGFNFSIKMDSASDAKCSKDPIGYFKLTRSFVENYTTLDENGKLRVFDSKVELIRAFVDYRLKKVGDKLDFEIGALTEKMRVLENKLNFVDNVINKRVDIAKHTRASLTALLTSSYKVTDPLVSPNEINRLIEIPMVDMTLDKIESMKADLADLERKLAEVKLTTIEGRYLKLLGEIGK